MLSYNSLLYHQLSDLANFTPIIIGAKNCLQKPQASLPALCVDLYEDQYAVQPLNPFFAAVISIIVFKTPKSRLQ